ncbi:hypothetical protein [Tuberibacillus sp. Marseille-P3662]|uniref:hypothetical protein n=1 Tax=Tuberibacillus sp. Marseille-P3662 TaxID=1965358 RepID=UPI001593DB2E|nr:hypothetical protein [Tuberibacillus sp. Marseille-P3662]
MKLSSDLFYQFYKNQWIMAWKHPGEEQLANDESVRAVSQPWTPQRHHKHWTT